MTPENILGSIIFSAIGFAAFVYGRNMGTLKPRIIGLLLIIYTYFVGSTVLLYAIGIALTASLFVFRD